MVALLSSAASPAIGQSADIDAQQALQQAIAARNDAQRALDAANRAIEAAQAALRGSVSPAAAVSSAQPVVTEASAAAPAFDPDAPPPPKEILCRADAQARYRVVNWPDDYRNECLAASKFKDLNISDLNFKIEGSKDSAAVEVVPAYTFRWRTYVPGQRDGFQLGTSYLRVRGGLRVNVDSGGNATFADLTVPNVTSGATAIGGVEFGGTLGRRDLKEYADKVAKTLKSARRACLAESLSAPKSDSLEGQSEIQLHNGAEAIDQCDEESLSAWMTKNKATYYHDLIPPLWDAKSGLRYYVGLQGTYSKPEFSFFPLVDPAGVGFPVDPNAYPDGEIKDPERVYSVKGYGGLVFGDLAAAGLSLSYRRDFKFPKGTKDQTVCKDGGDPYIRCRSVNIGPPYELKGWVVGGRAAVAIPRYAFLPPLGLELIPSYAFDVKQKGIVGSLFFASDSEGKTKSGIKLGCTSAGETKSGYPLEKDCKASLFFGTELNIEGRP
jgi:hypothetical protein